ncbi:MAG: hypothetical protein FWD73_00250 [Polyangiaceae bacterium]|nr:hypothetical protein [Polyangiaceae bacterium]
MASSHARTGALNGGGASLSGARLRRKSPPTESGDAGAWTELASFAGDTDTSQFAFVAFVAFAETLASPRSSTRWCECLIETVDLDRGRATDRDGRAGVVSARFVTGREAGHVPLPPARDELDLPRWAIPT